MTETRWVRDPATLQPGTPQSAHPFTSSTHPRKFGDCKTTQAGSSPLSAPCPAASVTPREPRGIVSTRIPPYRA